MRQRFRRRLSDDDKAKIADFQISSASEAKSLARSFGIEVVEEDLPSNVRGRLEENPLLGGKSGYRIILNKSDSIEEKRFTIGHELGHYLLHTNIDDVFFDRDRSTRWEVDPTEEFEADAFSEDLFMPIAIIDELFKRGVTDVSSISEHFWMPTERVARRVEFYYRLRRG